MLARPILTALAAISLAVIAMPAHAADTTPEQLLNAPKDGQNWLSVHRDYDNSRHSPLSDINRGSAKDLKLKFIMSIGGRATGGTLRGKEEATPLVEDGFMYVNDTWGRVMKFDVRSGTQACRCGVTTRRSSSPAPNAGSRCTATRCSSVPTTCA